MEELTKQHQPNDPPAELEGALPETPAANIAELDRQYTIAKAGELAEGEERQELLPAVKHGSMINLVEDRTLPVEKVAVGDTLVGGWRVVSHRGPDEHGVVTILVELNEGSDGKADLPLLSSGQVLSAANDSLGTEMPQYPLGPRGVKAPKDSRLPEKPRQETSAFLDAKDSVGNDREPQTAGPRGRRHFADTYHQPPKDEAKAGNTEAAPDDTHRP